MRYCRIRAHYSFKLVPVKSHRFSLVSSIRGGGERKIVDLFREISTSFFPLSIGSIDPMKIRRYNIVRINVEGFTRRGQRTGRAGFIVDSSRAIVSRTLPPGEFVRD